MRRDGKRLMLKLLKDSKNRRDRVGGVEFE